MAAEKDVDNETGNKKAMTAENNDLQTNFTS